MRIFLALFLMFFTFTACSVVDNTVSSDGSTSMERVIGGLGEAFTNETGINFAYNPTGSGSGITAVYEGRCDIGLSSRELKITELEKGLVSTVLAYDGIALIVNKSNPVSDLSSENIKKLFTSEITDWSCVGGNDAPVVLIGREAGSGTRDGFEAATDTENKCRYRQELTSAGDIITAVSNNPDAIGYASVSSIKDNVKIITVDGIEVNEENIKNGTYKIRRPFILVTSNSVLLSENARKFLDFATSSEAENIIRMMGAIPSDKR